MTLLRSISHAAAILVAVELSLCTPLPAIAEDAAATELNKLQGTWVVTAGEVEGKAFDDVKGAKFVFKGNRVTVNAMGKKMTLDCKLKPTARPRQIDLVPGEDSDGHDSPLAGIYEWNGGSLKFLFSGNSVEETTDSDGKIVRKETAGERPTVMDSKQGLMMTLEREVE